MSWGSSAGVGLLTAFAGGVSAGYLTYLIIEWFSLQRNDGADLGYYIVFVPVGLIAGLVVGVVMARFASNYWVAQGLSLAAILAICGVAGLVVRMYREVPPQLDRVSEIPKTPDFAVEREKAADAIPADAPVAQWLPLFEDPEETPAVYRWGGAERKERKAVAAKVLELAPLLQSGDRTVVRQAVFALGSLYDTPEALVDPLIAAGKWTVQLINDAGTDPDLGRKAQQYFDMWNIARKNAGAAQAGRFGAILGEIEKAARGAKGDWGSIMRAVRER